MCVHRSQTYVLLSSGSIHYRHNGGDARKAHVKHLVPSITATMEEMPERHTWAGQTMVSLDILCVSIDLRVYFLCPVIIQFHPLLPQWRGCQKEASSSIHYRHNGGDARKAHVKHPVPSITATMEEMPERHTLAGQTMVSLDILCVSIDLRVYFLCPVIIQFHPFLPQWRGCQKEASSSIHYRHNGGDARKAHVKHPVPSITATMEEMPERHTWAGQTMVSLDILCFHRSQSILLMSCYHPVPSIPATMEGMPERSIQFHPLPPQWRGCQKGTREASSSIHYRHNGGDARKAHVGWSNYGESRYFVCFHRSQSILLISCYHPVPSITATMEGMPERSIQFHPLPPQWRGCQKGTREASSSIHYRHNGGDARKAHVGRSNYGESRYFACFHRSQSILLMSCYHPVPSITSTMEGMPERSIRFHPLPPQWRGYQKGTREASSSIHYCHNGGDTR